ncbi:hypothetical protein NDU88_004320 [Pleurodeles waltl]|uniref:Uncharacterized protein n=1 Tax=Pleurodeles waltl TaxID=8319 RepID=A0AAV7M613_PLEWA|nr:hypothetical protein NDU88_004320 [Pleurodeles waltl]
MGRSRHHILSAPGALRALNGCTRKHQWMRPIRDNFRSSLGSIVQEEMLSGIRVRRKRRTALKQRRTTMTGGILSGQRTTPADGATRSGPRKTTPAGSLGPQDRWTRKAEKSTLRPRSVESVALAGTVPQWTGLHCKREEGGGSHEVRRKEKKGGKQVTVKRQQP